MLSEQEWTNEKDAEGQQIGAPVQKMEEDKTQECKEGNLGLIGMHQTQRATSQDTEPGNIPTISDHLLN